MTNFRIFGTLFFAAALGLGCSPALAQSTRTWVSGVGDDGNPCTRAAPCKTFAGAISRTVAGGEINCIDAGGFGVLTITKAITIGCSAVEAGILATGTTGIVINAGPTDQIVLDGLDIEGMGAGLDGIDIFQAGQVRIQHSTIRGFTTGGIYIAPGGGGGSLRVDVTDTMIVDNAGSGIRNKPTGGWSVFMLVDRTTISQNAGDGLMVNGTLTTGALSVVVRSSTSNYNGHCGFISYSNGASAQLTVDDSTAIGNTTTGVLAGGAGAKVLFSRLIVSGNGTGVAQSSQGIALSYGNSSIVGNTTNGSFGTASPLQ